MKRFTLVSIIIIISMVFSGSTFAQDNNEKTGEQIVDLFVKENGIALEKNSEEYLKFLDDILMGEYPEFTSIGSKYVSDQSDLDLVLEYATEQLSPLYKDFPIEEEEYEAIPPGVDDDLDTSDRDNQVQAYSRANAINYAYAYCGMDKILVTLISEAVTVRTLLARR
jgi:hypothetical protein